MAAGSASTRISDSYWHNHGWLLGWLRGKLGDAFDAADIAQDTYERVIDTGRLPEQAEQSRTYLARIAKHLVADLHRRRRLEYAYTEALALFDGLTYQAIADRMGVSLGLVRKYMLQAAQACFAVMAA